MEENDPLYQLWNPEEDNFELVLEDEFFDFFETDEENADSGNEFFTDDDEDDLGFFHTEDEYWCCVEGKRLFLKVKDASVAEASVFSQVKRSERRQGWHYEALLFLLEELETFFQAWKRRTSHSFTAHLKTSDQEYITDSDEEHPIKSQLTNAVLSKRKFCESTRIFYSIFPKYDLFYEVYREVQGIKKRILDIRFALFLSSIPPELVRQLPDELWLKIWRFSANPRDTLSLPFQPYFQESTVLVEKNRLNEFFLSVLRLHKILYKILFTFVLNNEPMQEMKAYPGAPKKVIESLFWTHLEDVKRSLERLNALDSSFKRDHLVKSMDFKSKISRGIFAFESIKLDGEFLEDVEQVGIGESFFMPESQSPVWNSSHVFFPNSLVNGTFLFLQKYLTDSNVYIRFLVWNAFSNTLVNIIYTGILLVDYISCLEYGYNMISFCGDHIAFTLPNLSSNELTFSTFKWTLGSSGKYSPPDTSPIRKTFHINAESYKYKPNTVSQVMGHLNGKNLTLLMFSVGEDSSSQLYEYRDSSCILISESFPPKSFMKDVKGDKILVMNRGQSTGNVVQLFDVSERKILYTYVSDNATDQFRSSILSMFDRAQDSQKFLIFLQNKRYYFLLDYSKNGDPIIGREGYIASEAEECLDESLTLYKDLLFFIEKGNQLQDRFQYYIKVFDFESTRIVTPIYMEDSSLVHPRVETYFAETKTIFFIGNDKLAFCRNRHTLFYLDFTADTVSSVLKELQFLQNNAE